MLAIIFRIIGRHRRRHIATLLAAAVLCVIGGAAAFSATQGKPFTTGMYWAIATATTVGYGDVTPHNGVGRLISVLVMLTTIPLLASVFALVTGSTVAAGIRRILAMHSVFPNQSYRLVVGMSPVVPVILDELIAAGVQVVLVADVEQAGLPPEVHLVRGDPTQPATIRRAGPEAAEQALITGATDGDVLVSAVLVRKLAPDLVIAALVDSPSVREALTEIGIQQAVSVHQLVAWTLAKTLEAPHAGDLMAQLMESAQHRLTELEAEDAVVGRPLSAIRDERAGLVLGLVHRGEFTLGLADDPVIAAGDRLLVAEKTEPAGQDPAAAR